MALRVALPPDRPVMIFDGDCSFCRFWVARWRVRLRGAVDFRPYQDEAQRYPEIPVDSFRRAVTLVLPDGSVYAAAEAVFRALALQRGRGTALTAYQSFPGFASFTEGAYRWIAAHRNLADAVTRRAWGTDPSPSTFRHSRWLFLRSLGAIFFVAFLSFWVQIDGLIGSRGISPAAEYLRAAAAQWGGSALRLIPSLCWVSSSDAALHALCALGALFSLLLVLDMAPALSAFFCWALYLSLAGVGQDFLSFQWDVLLIETGFLSIFLVDPVRLWKGSSSGARPPPRITIFLFRCLLFRLMFSSAVVKLASGDRTWRNLTALRFHYETQPLPTWIGWYAHQLPASFQRLSVVLLFAVELVAPFFLFAPRRLRNGALLSIALLQLMIGLTGNYAFFNLLAFALCLLALDDQTLRVPSGIRTVSAFSETDEPHSGSRSWPRPILGVTAALVLFLGAVRLAEVLFPRASATAALAGATSAAEPFRTVNGYGLFAVMTTSRPEIIIEGSDDARTWQAYVFRWKPGDVSRRPRFVEPHQPRLDWQLWFAALSDVRQNPWFIGFVHRLLEGSPDVVRLLASDPFAGKPPRFVRAELWDYRFTDTATRRTTGAWWTRRRIASYLPPVSLEDFRRHP